MDKSRLRFQRASRNEAKDRLGAVAEKGAQSICPVSRAGCHKSSAKLDGAHGGHK